MCASIAISTGGCRGVAGRAKSETAQSELTTQTFARRRLRDVLFISVGAACRFVLMSLLTYSDQDPGWSASGTGDAIQNLGGITGAFIADVFLSLVGSAAYLIPLLLAYRAISLLLAEGRYDPVDWQMLGLRAFGLLLAVMAATALRALNDVGASGLPQGAGGIVGAAIGLGFDQAFNPVGARLVLVTVFLLGLTLFADISWLSVIDWIGQCVLSAASAIRQMAAAKLDQFRDRRAREKQLEERKVKIERHVASEKKRTPPKIKPPKEPVAAGVKFEQEKQKPLFDLPISGEVPPLDLLDAPPSDVAQRGYSADELESLSRLLELKLKDFSVVAEVVAVYPGPVVTRFEIQPAAGVKVSRISNLAKDLARSLAVISVRVVEVIPGKSVVGIEIPNADRQTVNFKDVLASTTFEESKSPLTVALGHDIAGSPVVADLSKMPHVLVAGTTGSGKSVGVNCMLVSLLYKATPADVRLILVDPKMLELSVYDGIPHLLTPVITDMKDAANGLRWCVAEMERRY